MKQKTNPAPSRSGQALACLLVLFLVLGAASGCSPAGPPEGPQEETPSLRSYTDPGAGFVVTFPEEATGRIRILGSHVYDRAVYEATDGELGLLFTFQLFSREEYPEPGDLSLRAPAPTFWIGQTGEDHVGVVLASDVQVPPGEDTLLSDYRALGELLHPDNLTFRLEDFGTPRTGFVRSADPGDGTFRFAPMEWVTWEDGERIAELGLDPDRDMPNGYYLHDPGTGPLSLALDRAAVVILAVRLGSPLGAPAGPDLFFERVREWDGEMLADVFLRDGRVTAVQERYRP